MSSSHPYQTRSPTAHRLGACQSGYVTIEGRHGKLLQADFFPGPNGINELRTHRETDSLLRKYDGEGWEYVVAPESWLK